jgi:hypothetical protein
VNVVAMVVLAHDERARMVKHGKPLKRSLDLTLLNVVLLYQPIEKNWRMGKK